MSEAFFLVKQLQQLQSQFKFIFHMELVMKCPLTGLPIIHQEIVQNEFCYKITIGKHDQGIILPLNYKDWNSDLIYASNKHVIAGLIVNEKMFTFTHLWVKISIDSIKEKILKSNFPQSPQEKYDNLFMILFALQEYDGQEVEFYKINSSVLYKKAYFKNLEELKFYAQSLHKNGLIKSVTGGFDNSISQFNITYDGLAYAIKLESEGSKSKNCFIAMSFGDGMTEIREAIRGACVDTGYTAVLVDETHYDSDSTINDAIIANLKKSRFCIADFTEQKDGVYFESGYALGQGKQVIYTCREDWFKQSHFDLNHFPHIIYSTPLELQQKLINKIEAWIR